MICWELGKTIINCAATFWAILGHQGYHTVLLGELIPAFQMNIVSSKCQELLAQRCSIISQAPNITENVKSHM